MLTVDDLHAMRPSDAIEKAAELYPGVWYDWFSPQIPAPSLLERLLARWQQRPERVRGPGCPVALLAAATTKPWLGYYWSQNLGFEPPTKVAEVYRRLSGRYVIDYDDAISSLTCGCRSFAQAVETLRSLGL